MIQQQSDDAFCVFGVHWHVLLFKLCQYLQEELLIIPNLRDFGILLLQTNIIVFQSTKRRNCHLKYFLWSFCSLEIQLWFWCFAFVCQAQSFRCWRLLFLKKNRSKLFSFSLKLMFTACLVWIAPSQHFSLPNPSVQTNLCAARVNIQHLQLHSAFGQYGANVCSEPLLSLSKA